MNELRQSHKGITRQKPPIPDALQRQHRRQIRRAARRRRGGYAVAVAIAIATFVAIGVAGGGGPGVTPAGSDTPSPPALPSSVDPLAGALALPAAGAVPTTPVRGTLVLSLDDVTSNTGMDVYQDGSLIRYKLGDFSDDPNSIGVSVQRLTPHGVELLRDYALASGLFEDDLSLDRGGRAPFSQIQVDDGTRLVSLTWAWHGIVGPDAPIATPEQARAIEDLIAFLGDETAWPPGVWGDATTTAFIPAHYDVCMRGLPHRIDAASSVGMLPAPVVNLLWGEDAAPTGNGDVGCTRVSTDDARSLAGMFEVAGIVRTPEGSSAPEWLHYGIPQPDAGGNTLTIVFAPVLPSGEAIFIGPG